MRLDITANPERLRMTGHKRRVAIAPIGLKLVARHLGSPPQIEYQLDHLGEPTCAPTSRAFVRWRDPDSNRGHHDFQSCALPAELSRRGGSAMLARVYDQASQRSRSGSGSIVWPPAHHAPSQISKCRCGAVASPVWPTCPII